MEALTRLRLPIRPLHLPQEKRSLYTCQDGTRVYTVFTHLDYIHLKLELF